MGKNISETSSVLIYLDNFYDYFRPLFDISFVTHYFITHNLPYLHAQHPVIMYSPSNMGEMNQNGQQQVGMYDPNQQHVQHPIGQNQGKSDQIIFRKRSEE